MSSQEPQAVSLPPSLLVSATYDSQKKAAVLKFYDPESRKIILWADEIGHKPYCYSKLNPEELEFISSRKDVLKIDQIKRRDLLRDQDILVSKIIVDDPLAIGGTQTDKSIRNIIETWESDIKYYENYLYDRGLIVGRFYKTENGKIVPHNFELADDVNLALKSLLLDASTTKGIVNSSEFQEYVTQWAELLNQPVPKIRRVSLDIEVESEIGRIPDPKIAEKRVTAVGFEDSDGLKQVFVLRKNGSVDGQSQIPSDVKVVFYAESDEKKMIEDAFRFVEDYPFVITYNGDDFDMPYLYNRAERLGIKNSENPFYMMRDSATLKHGVHIDLYRTMSNKSFQIYAFSHKYTDFSLNSVSLALLGEAKIDHGVEFDKLENYQLAHYCYNDAKLTYRLTSFNNDLLMNLLVVISRIARMPIDDIARMGVSQWIRSLLYYEHRHRNALIPRRDEIDAKSQGVTNDAVIKDKKYRGGLVVDPTEGIHFNVTVMDFASLYPSIIKVRNLSYETVRCPHEECKKNTIPDTNHWVCTKYNGITSLLIGSLRDLRVNYYKSLAKTAKTEEQKQMYTVVSQALKVILNASYGVMGAEIFPLYFLPAAEATTAIGRYIIMETIKKCQANKIEVLYGDSVLPDTPITIRRKDGIDIVPLESLMPKTASGTRYDKFGDIDVLTEKGFTKIKHIYRHKVKKKGYRILTRKGFVECTEDHSLVVNGKEVSPANLKVGDKISLVPFKAESKVVVSPDLGWLFGIFIAEGTCGIYSYGKDTKYSWRIVNQDKKILQKAQEIIQKQLGLETKIIDIRKNPATYGLVPKGDNKLLVDYFRFLCYRGEEKAVPRTMLNADIVAKKAFIDGMLDGDGNTDGNKLTTLDQIHKSVLSGIISILEQFGVEYSLQIRKDKRNVCRIRIIRNRRDSRIKQSNMIKKIEAFTINGYVYDLETSNHHFCGGLGNILLHNTDSLFIKNTTREQIHQVIEDTKIEQGVDLEVDKDYRYVVLSNRKKNYLGVTKEGKVDVKGLTGKKSVDGKTPILANVNNIIKFSTVEQIYNEYNNNSNVKLLTITDDLQSAWSSISEATKHRVTNVYKVTTHNGRILTLSGDHSVYTINEYGQLNCKETRHLNSTDVLVGLKTISQTGTIKSINVFDHIGDITKEKNNQLISTIKHSTTGIPIKKKIPITPELGFLFGIYTAGGGFDIRNASITQNFKINKEVCKQIEKSWTSVFNTKIKKYKTNDDAYSYRMPFLISKLLGRLCGEKSNNKQIPDIIFNSDDITRTSYLRGLFSGDGFIDKKQISLTSKSKLLIEQTSYMLAYFNIASNIKLVTHKKYGKYYTLRVKSVGDRISFQNTIGFIQPRFKIKTNRTPMTKELLPISTIGILKIKKSILKRLRLAKFRNMNMHDLRQYNMSILDKYNKIIIQLSTYATRDEKTKLDSISKMLNSKDVTYDKISRVEKISGSQIMYDFAVPEHERFVAGNLPTLLHNSHTPPFIRNLFYELLDVLSKVQTAGDFENAKKQISEKITACAIKVKEKKIPISELAFNVMISKSISEYDKTIPQHIRAAKLLEQTREIKRGDIISYVKTINKPGVKPVEMARPDEIDSAKYMEFMESTLDQITSSMDLDFDTMVGKPKQTGLDQFFWS